MKTHKISIGCNGINNAFSAKNISYSRNKKYFYVFIAESFWDNRSLGPSASVSIPVSIAAFHYNAFLGIYQKSPETYTKIILNIASEFNRRLRHMDARLVELKYGLDKKEVRFINSTSDLRKIDKAIELIITANCKEDVLGALK